MDEFLLLNPGPVPVPESVRSAMAAPMLSHRSETFAATFARAQEGLEYVFTRSSSDGASTSSGGDTLILNATATMGMDAALANLVSPGDHVVSVVNGKFGRRFARIAERYTSDVTRVSVEWGASIDPGGVADAIDDDTVAVTAVHTETSAGLRNPVGDIGAIAADHDAAFVVDGVSGIGGDEFHIDAWNVDIAITDAQKALGIPPGIAGMYVTDGIQHRFDGEGAPFYEDLEWHLDKAAIHQTPFTTAIPQVRALAKAADLIGDEGMANRIARHRRQSGAYRAAFEAMGLELFPDPEGPTEYATTMTAVELPPAAAGEGFDAFTQALTDRNASVAGGQAHLSGQIIRVSNMAWFDDETVLEGIDRIAGALEDVGAAIDRERGMAAARQTLS